MTAALRRGMVVNMARRRTIPRVLRWLGTALEQDMSLVWSCCGTPALGHFPATPSPDVGRHARIWRCTHCGYLWRQTAAPVGEQAEWHPLAPDPPSR